jgi:hypothetical protein
MHFIGDDVPEKEREPVVDGYGQGGVAPAYYIRRHRTPRVQYSLRTKLIGYLIAFCVITFFVWVYLTMMYQSGVHP